MSILDQLFPDLQTSDPAENPVEVRKLEPEDWIISATALAAHQAMNNGFSPGIERIETHLYRPEFSSKGIVSVAQSLKVNKTYRQLLVEEQLQDVRYKPTADDVVDGGIKNGSKVIIKIVPENEDSHESWGGLVQARLQENRGVPKNLTFDKFSVLSITEPDEQRYQIHETFGADILQGFGHRPRILTLTGQVVNGKLDVSVGGVVRSMDWKNAFQRYYEQHYSAHACIRRRKKVRIFSQDTVYDGYMLNMVSATTAMDQGLSQVTITFLMAKRNFPRENDHLIPGWQVEPGQPILTGRETFRQITKHPEIHEYFQENYDSFITDEYFRLGKEIDELAEQIGTLDGVGGQEILSNMREFGDLGPSEIYTRPGLQFRMHKFLTASNTEDAIISYDTQLANFQARVDDYHESVSVATVQREIIKVDPLTGAPADVEEFEALKAEEARLRNMRQGLVKRLDKLNTLCEELQNLYLYRQNIEGNFANQEKLDLDTISTLTTTA